MNAQTGSVHVHASYVQKCLMCEVVDVCASCAHVPHSPRVQGLWLCEECDRLRRAGQLPIEARGKCVFCAAGIAISRGSDTLIGQGVELCAAMCQLPTCIGHREPSRIGGVPPGSCEPCASDLCVGGLK